MEPLEVIKDIFPLPCPEDVDKSVVVMFPAACSRMSPPKPLLPLLFKKPKVVLIDPLEVIKEIFAPLVDQLIH